MGPPTEDGTDRASALRDAAETEPETVDADAVVDLLVRGDPATRRIAFEAYEELLATRPTAADAAAARLKTRLADDAAHTRRRAALTAGALVEAHPRACESVVPELRSIGDDPAEPGREPAVLALATLALERPSAAVSAVETLFGMCADPVVPVADDDAPGLGPDRTAAAGPDRERRDEVRVRAAAGLTRIASEDPGAVREHASEVADLLEDDHRLVRAAACELLETLATAFPAVVEPFAAELATLLASDTVAPVPWRAADALVALGAERPERVGEAVEPIVGDLSPSLESPDPERRAVGVALLARAARVRPDSVEPTVPTLRESLGDGDAAVRAEAALALGFASVRAARGTVAELAEGDPDPDVREAAERSLALLGREEANDG